MGISAQLKLTGVKPDNESRDVTASTGSVSLKSECSPQDVIHFLRPDPFNRPTTESLSVCERASWKGSGRKKFTPFLYAELFSDADPNERLPDPREDAVLCRGSGSMPDSESLTNAHRVSIVKT